MALKSRNEGAATEMGAECFVSRDKNPNILQVYIHSAPTEPGGESKLNFPAPRCCSQPFPTADPAGSALCCHNFPLFVANSPGRFPHFPALMDTAPGWGLGDRGANLRACYRQFLPFSLCLCLISGWREQMLLSKRKSIQ